MFLLDESLELCRETLRLRATTYCCGEPWPSFGDGAGVLLQLRSCSWRLYHTTMSRRLYHMTLSLGRVPGDCTTRRRLSVVFLRLGRVPVDCTTRHCLERPLPPGPAAPHPGTDRQTVRRRRATPSPAGTSPTATSTSHGIPSDGVTATRRLQLRFYFDSIAVRLPFDSVA